MHKSRSSICQNETSFWSKFVQALFPVHGKGGCLACDSMSELSLDAILLQSINHRTHLSGYILNRIGPSPVDLS
jgi:hypothetical protein